MKTKRVITAIIAVVIFVMMSLTCVSAAIYIIDDGFKFTRESTGYITIHEYVGTEENVAVPSTLVNKSVVAINEYAFMHNYVIKTMTIPDTVASIGRGAFYGCEFLKGVSLPAMLEEVSQYCFAYCDSIETITLSSTVNIIDKNAFLECYNLTDVYYEGSEEQWNEIVFEEGNDCLTNATIHFNATVADLAGYSLTLEGNIGVNFYLDIPKHILTDSNAKVVFTYGDITAEVPVNEGVATANGYKFTCSIPAKDMASDVTCKVVSLGKESDEYTYAVVDYAEVILANPTVYGERVVNLVKSMLNYGTAAQEYFGYNTDNFVNSTEYMTDDDRIVAVKDFSDYEFILTEGEGDVKYYGSALSLESETTLKHYFVISDDVDVSKLTVTVDSKPAEIKKNGNLYVFVIENIPAHKLYETYNVAVGDVSLDYGVFSYGLVAQNAGKTTLVKLMSALETYAQSAAKFLS